MHSPMLARGQPRRCPGRDAPLLAAFITAPKSERQGTDACQNSSGAAESHEWSLIEYTEKQNAAGTGRATEGIILGLEGSFRCRHIPVPPTHREDPSMSLRQLTRSTLITLHSGIAPALCAVLLTGIAACAKGQDAEAAANSGAYSDSVAGAPATQREDASPVSVRLSEWKLELSRLTVPTGEVEFTVTNGGTMLHAFEVEGQGLEKDLEPIKVGATSTLRLTLPPGSYELYCPIDNGAHKKMGMIAHLEVLGSVDVGKLA